MNNSTCIIYGKTVDGRDVTLDGYKVECIADLTTPNEDYNRANLILEIVFNSGHTVCMMEDDYLRSKFIEGMQFDKTRIVSPSPYNLVDYETVDGRWGTLDSNAVECLISCVQQGREYVELHFSSGKILTVLADSLDAKGNIKEDDIDNVLIDFIYRYNKKNPLIQSGK